MVDRGKARIVALAAAAGIAGLIVSCAKKEDPAREEQEALIRNRAETAARQAKTMRPQQDPAPQQPPGAVKQSFGCPVTAERMISKMRSCGLNVAGITSDKLCNTMDTNKIAFAASRTCEDLQVILSGSSQ